MHVLKLQWEPRSADEAAWRQPGSGEAHWPRGPEDGVARRARPPQHRHQLHDAAGAAGQPDGHAPLSVVVACARRHTL
eukprot:scaffold675238_cov71-Prasinocladus_malaysianus.AAC.2